MKQALMMQTIVIKAKDTERVFSIHLKERWADLPLKIGAHLFFNRAHAQAIS